MADRAHICELFQESQSCLPALKPQANNCSRLLRNNKKWFLPTWNHPLSHMYFRSSASLLEEKRRYIRHNRWFILHPFSNFNIFREVYMFFIWATGYFYKPYTRAFIVFEDRVKYGYQAVSRFMDACEILNMIMYFITGYWDSKTKHIELSLKKTMLNYIRTYLFSDLLIIFPLCLGRFKNILPPKVLFVCDKLFFFVRLIIYMARMKTFFSYMRHLTIRLSINEHQHNIISMVLIGVVILHWCTCSLMLLSPTYTELRNNSTFSIGNYDINTLVFYLQGLSKVLCHFLRGGTGMILSKTYHTGEQLVLILVCFLSYSYHIYVVVRVLQMVSTQSVSEIKYEEMLVELKHFLKMKKLPTYLEQCILEYYDHRYQKKYFQEQNINAMLSEHLNNEIILTSCKHLINHSKVFKGLSKYATGIIVAYLKPDVFLNNEVVIRSGDTADSVYFISYGTVALYAEDGLELYHLEDGDLIWESENNIFTYEVIATEITEVFRWKRKHFEHCLETIPSLSTRLMEIKQEREILQSNLQAQKEGDLDTSNLMKQLARGRILDRLKVRSKINDHI